MMVKIKKSDLKEANNTINDTINFLLVSLDFADDDGEKEVTKLIDNLRNIQYNILYKTEN